MRNLLWAAPLLFFGMQMCASAATILPGTRIQVRTDQPIHLRAWDEGRIYPATVAHDVYGRDGNLVLPRGANAELIVRKLSPDEMALDIESVTVNGTRYALDTTGPEYHMPSAEYQNGTGLLGAIVGSVTNGQAEVVTRGPEIRVPPDSVLTFRLVEPLHVVTWAEPGFNRDGNHYHQPAEWYR